MPTTGAGYVGLAKEAGYGTVTAPTTFIPVKSAGLSSDPQNYYPQEIRGSRSQGKAVPMGRKNSGSIEADAEPQTLGHFLLAALGQVNTTTPSAGVYQHVFTPANALPSYSIERYDSTMIQRASGCKVDKLSLSLEAGSDGVLAISADFMAQTLTDQEAAAVPNYSDKTPFVFSDVTVTKGNAVNSNINKVEINLENGLKDDHFVLRPSRDVAAISEGMRKVSGSVDMYFTNKAEYLAFFNGTKDSLKLEFVGGIISGASTDNLTIELPNILWDKFDVPMGGPDDEVMASMDFTALYDSGIGGEIKATLQNAVTGY